MVFTFIARFGRKSMGCGARHNARFATGAEGAHEVESDAGTNTVRVTLSNYLFMVTTDGRVVQLNLGSTAQTVLATGGSRGVLITSDPNGSLLITQTDRILRLGPPSGGSFDKAVFTLSNTTTNVSASGGGGTVNVTANPATSALTSSSNASWIMITLGLTGTGNGAVGYSVAANTGDNARTGTLTIAGLTFTVTQAASSGGRVTPNTFTLSASSASIGASGGTGSTQVTATVQTTAWTASSGASWLTITSGAAGTGNGTVRYLVGANAGVNSRTGTMAIAGLPFTVTQSAAGGGTEPAPVFRIDPPIISIPADLYSGTVSITASSQTAAWTVSSKFAWITITGGSVDTGNGSLSYTVSANGSTSPRSGSLVIAGATFTVTQDGGTVSDGGGLPDGATCVSGQLDEITFSLSTFASKMADEVSASVASNCAKHAS